MTDTNPPADRAAEPRPRNQQCMNCGDTRGGPVGHETSECTYVPTRRGSKPDLAAAVARHNEQLSLEDRAAVKAHAARILERDRRVDQLAAAIGIAKRSASEHTGREAEIRARLDNAAIRDVPDEATDFELSRRKTAVLVLGMHALADLTYLLARVEELERQLAKVESELDEQRWYGEQLQTSVVSCSGNHLEIEEYPGGGSDEH